MYDEVILKYIVSHEYTVIMVIVDPILKKSIAD